MSDRRTATSLTRQLAKDEDGASQPVPQTHSQIIDLVSRGRKIDIILEVAKAMGSARNLEVLLDLVTEAARQVGEADRCTLYIHDSEAGELWAKIAHGVDGDTIRLAIGKGIAGYVAESRKALVIPDAYADPRFNQEVDKSTGYRTRNIMCVPMLDNDGEVTGVIQLLNKRENLAFNEEDQELLMALGGQAAVAVENAILHQDIEQLFAGFIKASVYAIEARDPTTSGHSERVAELTVGIARNIERVDTGPYADVRVGDDVLRELRYAALLHDFGKVGVREHVLLKAQKLYPQQFDNIRQRMEYARRTIEYTNMCKRYELVAAKGAQPVREKLRELDAELQRELTQLDEFMELIITCNKPTVLEEGNFSRLQDIAVAEYVDGQGQKRKLLLPDELVCLSIPRGSLNQEERQEIESHVTFTYRFLSRIPWTRDLKNVPSIAYAHHEKLNGGGYPRSLNAERIPMQSRIMTIADIYDALTASDRPYKKAVPHPKALDILHSDAKRGALDKDLLQIFIDAEVYKVV